MSAAADLGPQPVCPAYKVGDIMIARDQVCTFTGLQDAKEATEQCFESHVLLALCFQAWAGELR